MDREEQERLRHEAWKLLRQGLGSFLGVAALGALLIALTSILGGAWNGTLIVIAVLVASLFFFLPATLFAREGWTQRGLLLFRDLHRGYVFVFGGTLTDLDLLQTEDGADTAQRRLLQLGSLHLDTALLQSVEVLPVSRRVWRAGGERVKPWVETRWRRVAAPPEGVRPWPRAGVSAASGSSPGRRSLSERERAELLREAHQHWFRPFVPALLLTSWCLFVAVLAAVGVVTAGKWTASSVPWGSLHLLWLAFAADAFFLRRWGQARKMYQDARGGEVASSVASSVDSPPDGSESAVVSETLPNSGRLWTQAGRPAPWRRIGR